MKKLMIALMASALAVGVNAASINWAATKGFLYNGAGDSAAKITSGTAYLMLSTYKQEDLVSAFAKANGKADATISSMESATGKYLGTGEISDTAKISGSGSVTSTDAISAYFVVFNGDNMYISSTAESTYDAMATEHTITFSTMTASSKAVPMSASSGYNGAGWYNVPEPTSAMLLLIGFAGLALKRKNA